MADTTIDLLKNSSYVGKMDELIAAVKLGGSATSDVEWNNVKNKPTTIGGYGITDAKIDNGTITLGNQTITPLTSAPVTSVNSKTGAVTLSADDVSAIPSTLTGTAGQVLTKTADGQEWKDVDIPTALPNPNALTFTGAVTGSYDGSAPLSVEIPSGGGGLTVTNTAAVGQTVKITSVDENGQPTEWEAVDFSSGGDAGKSVRHIATVSVTAGTTSYSVTVDSNGDALNLESVYILTEKFWGDNGSYVQVKINGKELTRAYRAPSVSFAFHAIRSANLLYSSSKRGAFCR